MADDRLLKTIRACSLCKEHLPLDPRPVLNFSAQAEIMITGQAPGIKAHESNTPWNDASGNRLRDWLGISKEEFYDPKKIAIVPMGFCYPGKGKSGDLPPRPECSEKWMERIRDHLKNVKFHILIGSYAIKYFLGEDDLTQTVKNWKKYFPEVIPLPHPSPRNNIWLKKNSWFEKDLVPVLQREIQNKI